MDESSGPAFEREVGWWRTADELAEGEDSPPASRTVQAGCYRQMSLGADGS